MPASRLIAEECTITLTDMGTNSSPFSNAVNVTAFARSVKGGLETDKMARLDGIGERSRKQRVAKFKNDYSIELVEDSALAGGIAVGNNVRLQVPEVGIDFVGLCMKNEPNIVDGQEVTRQLDISDGE